MLSRLTQVGALVMVGVLLWQVWEQTDPATRAHHVEVVTYNCRRVVRRIARHYEPAWKAELRENHCVEH